ncbi:uncharacterized protein si:dkey-183p4.10 [Dunckerocampus dactyliophorus]|uniref:uncharacterized protein si:dkey-183p4.10 n=1 Tax=Dunckerocampus dactyliophorus TaxID=161453 RepID=UPI002406C741|nr:uncharacterized protein si:dkey-183p4.10 [Dunckerocampus dactyliophorus]
MDQRLADLLRDAFSGTSFPDRDLDFESLKLDESGDNGEAKEAGSALYQEATDDTGNVRGEDTAHANEQQAKEAGAVSMHGTPEDSHLNLDEGQEDEGKEMGHFLPLHNDFCSHKNKEFGEGQALLLEATHTLQVEDIRDEEVSDFVSTLKGDATEDDMQKKEEKTQGESFDVEANVGFMEDLIAEKVKDFSGEEHQEAGESYADYPSDFSPCEYGENEAHAPERCHQWSIYDITSSVQHLERPAWPKRREDTDMVESNISQQPANDVNMVAQCEDITSHDQGSLDDCFFYTPEALSIPETGSVLDDDQEDEERSWEEEQKRIEAFFRFYNDSDGELEREGRETKVQFCTKPMSEILHYDSESLSSSDEEQGLRMAGAPEEWMERQENRQMKSDYHLSGASKHQPNACNTQLCDRRNMLPRLLSLTLKMGLVTLIGLLMFWLAAYQMDLLSLFYFC